MLVLDRPRSWSQDFSFPLSTVRSVCAGEDGATNQIGTFSASTGAMKGRRKAVKETLSCHLPSSIHPLPLSEHNGREKNKALVPIAACLHED